MRSFILCLLLFASLVMQAQDLIVIRDKHGFRKGFKSISTGDTAIKPIYTDALNFSEGLAAVESYNSTDGSRWGYIDTTGTLVLPFQYLDAGSFVNGHAWVYLAEERYSTNNYVIDKTGKVYMSVAKDYPIKKIELSFGLYEGEWYRTSSNDFMPSGKGTYYYKYGSMYIGDVLNAMRNSKGKYISAKGMIYDGDWDWNKPHGKGKAVYPDGRVKEGYWEKGVFKGTKPQT